MAVAKLLEKRQAEIEAEVDLTFFLLVNNTALNGIVSYFHCAFFFSFLFKRKRKNVQIHIRTS